jgi:MFS transporter, CP family, cyanate transporter
VTTSDRTVTRHPILLGVAIALVAANLRPALASVGPVLGDLRADLAVTGTQVALLVTVPVACLGALATAAPSLGRRWGMEPVVAGVLATITVGLLLRVVGGTGLLFAGTMLASGAIAVANVLLPALIKRDFPAHSGTMMGVYTMALSGSAAVAAAATVPIGDLLGSLGGDRSGSAWRAALGAWAVPAAVALLLWLPFARGHTPPPAATGARPETLVRNPLAWQVTVFFGLQSLSFYAVLGWLPTIYRDAGYSPAAAGLVLSASAFVQIPVVLLLPRFAARAPDQRRYVAVATVLTAGGLLGVLVAPTTWPYAWAAVLGIGQGAAFAVALLLLVVRSRHPADTARLSAMAQSVGYLIAATGPLLVGAVHEATAAWTVPLLLLLALLVPQAATGILAGRARYLDGRG